MCDTLEKIEYNKIRLFEGGICPIRLENVETNGYPVLQQFPDLFRNGQKRFDNSKLVMKR